MPSRRWHLIDGFAGQSVLGEIPDHLRLGKAQLDLHLLREHLIRLGARVCEEVL